MRSSSSITMRASSMSWLLDASIARSVMLDHEVEAAERLVLERRQFLVE